MERTCECKEFPYYHSTITHIILMHMTRPGSLHELFYACEVHWTHYMDSSLFEVHRLPGSGPDQPIGP
jgi:hypothetical protein